MSPLLGRDPASSIFPVATAASPGQHPTVASTPGGREAGAVGKPPMTTMWLGGKPPPRGAWQGPCPPLCPGVGVWPAGAIPLGGYSWYQGIDCTDVCWHHPVTPSLRHTGRCGLAGRLGAAAGAPPGCAGVGGISAHLQPPCPLSQQHCLHPCCPIHTCPHKRPGCSKTLPAHQAGRFRGVGCHFSCSPLAYGPTVLHSPLPPPGRHGALPSCPASIPGLEIALNQGTCGASCHAGLRGPVEMGAPGLSPPPSARRGVGDGAQHPGSPSLKILTGDHVGRHGSTTLAQPSHVPSRRRWGWCCRGYFYHVFRPVVSRLLPNWEPKVT